MSSTDIGTDSRRYTLTRQDVGADKRIRVRVLFDDDDGYLESLLSAAVDTGTATGAPAISGTPRFGRDAHRRHERNL